MRILQISSADEGGGAERVAGDLFRSYRAAGLSSALAVGQKLGADPDVYQIPRHEHRGVWTRAWIDAGHRASAGRSLRAAGRINALAHAIGEPARCVRRLAGHEDFDFPGSWPLLDLPPRRPDILHAHNLHGGYFDLRALPFLSAQVPMVLTLHDQWLLTGHCAHSFGCDRWKSGCGNCPDLKIPPEIRRDATAYNWRRKAQIYSRSRLYVSTPSRWLMDRVMQSALSRAAIQTRVIPNGVDMSLFHPGDRRAARARLGLPQERTIVLFAAKAARANRFKDYATIASAVRRLGESSGIQNDLLFLALGDDGVIERYGKAELRPVPFLADPKLVADYYRSADIYVHAAKADTFPTTILEAFACGVPVVATAVGGIPEQVKSLPTAGVSHPSHDPGEATGILVPPADDQAMTHALRRLLTDATLRNQLAGNAAADAQLRFDLRRQVGDTIKWYREIHAERSRSNDLPH